MSGLSSLWPHGLSTGCGIISAILLAGLWYSDSERSRCTDLECSLFQISIFINKLELI